MRQLLNLCALVGLLGSVTGCVSRIVILDSQKDVVRLGEDVRGHVYIQKGGQWVRTGGKITLPAGWWAGPGPQD